MKFRNGFVSNSSSASFIIEFSSSLPFKKIKELLMSCDSNLDWKQKNNKFTLKEGFFGEDYLEKYNNRYYLSQSTSMFNDWSDIYCWKFLRAIKDDLIEDTHITNIIQTEDQFETCNIRVDYESEIWQEKHYQKEKRYEEVIDSYENSYIEYLEKNKLISEEDKKILESKRLLSK